MKTINRISLVSLPDVDQNCTKIVRNEAQ